jgi:hypothetical protein
MRAMYGVDGGIKYDITKTLNISGNVRDIFNTRKFRSDINYNTPYFTSTQISERRFSTRTAIFTLAYRFGNNGIPQKRKDKNKDNQQQDQDNTPDDNGGGQQGGNGGGQPPVKSKG